LKGYADLAIFSTLSAEADNLQQRPFLRSISLLVPS
jgi:hypothetical protein